MPKISAYIRATPIFPYPYAPSAIKASFHLALLPCLTDIPDRTLRHVDIANKQRVQGARGPFRRSVGDGPSECEDGTDARPSEKCPKGLVPCYGVWKGACS